MARQKSDDRVVPEGCRKTVPTRDTEQLGGGKAVTVNEQMGQLQLPFDTAESPEAQAKGADGEAALRERRAATRAAPKSKGKKRTAPSATMEERSNRTLSPREDNFGCLWDRRGRNPAGGEGHNSPSRRAVCEQHKYGSVGAGGRKAPSYPMTRDGRLRLLHSSVIG